MRRVAAHYLYLPGGNRIHLPVVELEGDKVINYYPIEDELPVTEWLGGIIILSSVSQMCISPTDTLQTIIHRLTKQGLTFTLYSWYSSSLDMNKQGVEICVLKE